MKLGMKREPEKQEEEPVLIGLEKDEGGINIIAYRGKKEKTVATINDDGTLYLFSQENLHKFGFQTNSNGEILTR